MPRKAAKFPPTAFTKNSGVPSCVGNVKDHYLGPFGSAESHERYAELIERWRLAKAAPQGTARTTSLPGAFRERVTAQVLGLRGIVLLEPRTADQELSACVMPSDPSSDFTATRSFVTSVPSP